MNRRLVDLAWWPLDVAITLWWAIRAGRNERSRR